MNKFNNLFYKLTHNETLLVENIKEIYFAANNILYETNEILPCPKKLFQIVKNEFIKLIQNKNYSSVKINLKDALTDEFFLNQEDKNLTKTLFQLFKNHDKAFFNIKIEGNENFYFDKKGEFQLPKEFTENLMETSYLHYSYPRIKPLLLNNDFLNKFVNDYKTDIKYLKSMYDKQQIALELFRKNILNINEFGTIVIYPWNCTEDDKNINLPTLDEVIEHECQHLCIFLLSLAKTCIYIGIHFSNNIKESTFSYQLKEKEFITLTGSYCNILIRIFKSIPEPKTINEFIKTVLDLSLFERTNQDKKYIDALTVSQQFSRIREFYKKIYIDSKFGLYEKCSKKPCTKIIHNNKFKTLLKWTLKNFQNNLKEELK